MRYRAQSATGDYQFGRTGIFLVNTPAAVAQSIKTRLLLWTDEWFLDNTEGTPFNPLVLGHHTQATRDLVFQQRILDTPGVEEILNYYSTIDAARRFEVVATVRTTYGVVQLNVGVQ